MGTEAKCPDIFRMATSGLWWHRTWVPKGVAGRALTWEEEGWLGAMLCTNRLANNGKMSNCQW